MKLCLCHCIPYQIQISAEEAGLPLGRVLINLFCAWLLKGLSFLKKQIVVNQFDTTAVPEERKTTEERSKRKEKRKNKNIFQGENAQGAKAGSARLLDKSEEDSADHQGLSRYRFLDLFLTFTLSWDLSSYLPCPGSRHSLLTSLGSNSVRWLGFNPRLLVQTGSRIMHFERTQSSS